ncbi:glycosyltransferase family 4 protein [Streptomyces sudanensis]|nr:glycosyltransferase family 4 protein [Streptomyces sudanensis]MCQ0000487.1 glycosyltransferase family 4 protein [Streptomyces sudanensis]
MNSHVLYLALGTYRVRATREQVKELASSGSRVSLVVLDAPEWREALEELGRLDGVSVLRVTPDKNGTAWGSAKRLAAARSGPFATADTVIAGDAQALPVAWIAKRRRPGVALMLEPYGAGRVVEPADLAVLTPWYPSPNNPYAGSFVQAATAAVAGNYDRVTVFHTEDWSGRGSAALSDAIRVTTDRLRERNALGHVVDTDEATVVRVPVPITSRKNYAPWVEAQVKALRSALPGGRIEAPVVHAHTGIYGGVLATRLARPDARVVVTEHASFLERVFSQAPAADLYEQVLERADAFLCVSAALREQGPEALPAVRGQGGCRAQPGLPGPLHAGPGALPGAAALAVPGPARRAEGRQGAAGGVRAGRRGGAARHPHDGRARHRRGGAARTRRRTGPRGALPHTPAGRPGGRGPADARVRPARARQQAGDLRDDDRRGDRVRPPRPHDPQRRPPGDAEGHRDAGRCAHGRQRRPAGHRRRVPGAARPRRRPGPAGGPRGAGGPDRLRGGRQAARRGVRGRDAPVPDPEPETEPEAVDGAGAEAAGDAEPAGTQAPAEVEPTGSAEPAGSAPAVRPDEPVGRAVVLALTPAKPRRIVDFANHLVGKGVEVTLVTAQSPALWEGLRLDPDVPVVSIQDAEKKLHIPRAERFLVYRAPRAVLRRARRLAAKNREAIGPELAVATVQRAHTKVANAFHKKVFNRGYREVRPQLFARIAKQRVLPELRLDMVDTVFVSDINSTVTGWKWAKSHPHLKVTASLDRTAYDPE